MATIANTYLPRHQTLYLALQRIYGIGPHMAHQLCDHMKVNPRCQVKTLTRNQFEKLSRLVAYSYIVGPKLKRMIHQDMSRWVAISSYRGFRYIQKLPVRGQRTHTNAQTCRRQIPSLQKARRKKK